MSTSYRIFIIEEERLVRISQVTFKKFYFENKPVLPQYANKVIMIAVVFVDYVERVPQQIKRIDVARIKVLAEGAIDQDHQLQVLLLVERAQHSRTVDTASTSSVVDANPRFARRRMMVERPDLPPAALKLILDEIFGPS